MQKCSRCGVSKDPSAFYQQKHGLFPALLSYLEGETL